MAANGEDSSSQRCRDAQLAAKQFSVCHPTKFQVAREFGYSEEVIQDAVYKRFLIKGPYLSAGELIDDLFDCESVTGNDEKDKRLNILRKETLENWCRLHCISCSNRKNTLFLPCCHALFCDKCSKAHTYCILCFCNIEDTLLIYIS